MLVQSATYFCPFPLLLMEIFYGPLLIPTYFSPQGQALSIQGLSTYLYSDHAPRHESFPLKTFTKSLFSPSLSFGLHKLYGDLLRPLLPSGGIPYFPLITRTKMTLENSVGG